MTETVVTRVYLRTVRTQLMSLRVKPVTPHNHNFSSKWDVYLDTPDGERIVRHSDDPEHDAARVLRDRGIKGVMQSWRRRVDGSEIHCMTFNIKRAALTTWSGHTWKPSKKKVGLTVEVLPGDCEGWPPIADADDEAAFEAYLADPERVARKERNLAATRAWGATTKNKKPSAPS